MKAEPTQVKPEREAVAAAPAPAAAVEQCVPPQSAASIWQWQSYPPLQPLQPELPRGRFTAAMRSFPVGQHPAPACYGRENSPLQRPVMPHASPRTVTEQLRSTKAVPSHQKNQLARERSRLATSSLASTDADAQADAIDSSDEEGAHKQKLPAVPKPPTSRPPPGPKEPNVPETVTRAFWNKRFNTELNNVFSNELAGPAPPPLAGTSADVGRFVLLPLAAYPDLEVETVSGTSKHLGWSLKIIAVSKSGYSLKEKGQSPTVMPLATVSDFTLLSV